MRIDGESYRLARATGLSIIEKAALKRATLRMAAIEKKAQPTEADAREYRKLSEEIVRIAIPDAPHPTITALSLEQLGQAIVTFFGRTAATSGVIAAVRELQADSGRASRASSGSMAGTR